MARNAKQILTASLREINKGKWVCGDLCQVPEEFPGDTAKDKDLLGCALGLVSIYGNDTVPDSMTAWIYDQATGLAEPHTVRYEAARYADSGSPDAVKRAIYALYLAIPKKKNRGGDFDPLASCGDEDSLLEYLNSSVYSHNDCTIGYMKTQKGRTNRAIKWFEKAIALVGTTPVPVVKKLETVELENAEDLALAS